MNKYLNMKYPFKILISLIILSSCSDTGNEDNPDCTLTPNLNTEEASNVTETNATFSGQIIAPTCESTVTSQGFVYAKTTLPKTDDIVIEVNGENISSEVSNLDRNTTYYMRTFFVNPTGEYYGNEIEFTTAIGELDITTKTIENIKLNSALGGGIINDDGDGTITSKGICWSTSQNPTIDDNHIEDNTNSYDFNSNITGLQQNTIYYVRAYAINENGIKYGNEETFTTQSSTYNVELNITGYTNSCSVEAPYFYYEINYKIDDNEVVFEAAEGFEGTSWSHPHSSTQGVSESAIENNLEITIHLAQFNPDNPIETFKGAYLDNMSLVITNVESSEEVLNITLPALFICTDVAYKNIINFNPVDNSHTVEQLTYGF